MIASFLSRLLICTADLIMLSLMIAFFLSRLLIHIANLIILLLMIAFFLSRLLVCIADLIILLLIIAVAIASCSLGAKGIRHEGLEKSSCDVNALSTYWLLVQIVGSVEQSSVVRIA